MEKSIIKVYNSSVSKDGIFDFQCPEMTGLDKDGNETNQFQVKIQDAAPQISIQSEIDGMGAAAFNVVDVIMSPVDLRMHGGDPTETAIYWLLDSLRHYLNVIALCISGNDKVKLDRLQKRGIVLLCQETGVVLYDTDLYTVDSSRFKRELRLEDTFLFTAKQMDKGRADIDDTFFRFVDCYIVESDLMRVAVNKLRDIIADTLVEQIKKKAGPERQYTISVPVQAESDTVEITVQKNGEFLLTAEYERKTSVMRSGIDAHITFEPLVQVVPKRESMIILGLFQDIIRRDRYYDCLYENSLDPKRLATLCLLLETIHKSETVYPAHIYFRYRGFLFRLDVNDNGTGLHLLYNEGHPIMYPDEALNEAIFVDVNIDVERIVAVMLETMLHLIQNGALLKLKDKEAEEPKDETFDVLTDRYVKPEEESKGEGQHALSPEAIKKAHANPQAYTNLMNRVFNQGKENEEMDKAKEKNKYLKPGEKPKGKGNGKKNKDKCEKYLKEIRDILLDIYRIEFAEKGSYKNPPNSMVNTNNSQALNLPNLLSLVGGSRTNIEPAEPEPDEPSDKYIRQIRYTLSECISIDPEDKLKQKISVDNREVLLTLFKKENGEEVAIGEETKAHLYPAFPAIWFEVSENELLLQYNGKLGTKRSPLKSLNYSELYLKNDIWGSIDYFRERYSSGEIHRGTCAHWIAEIIGHAAVKCVLGSGEKVHPLVKVESNVYFKYNGEDAKEELACINEVFAPEPTPETPMYLKIKIDFVASHLVDYIFNHLSQKPKDNPYAKTLLCKTFVEGFVSNTVESPYDFSISAKLANIRHSREYVIIEAVRHGKESALKIIKDHTVPGSGMASARSADNLATLFMVSNEYDQFRGPDGSPDIKMCLIKYIANELAILAYEGHADSLPCGSTICASVEALNYTDSQTFEVDVETATKLNVKLDPEAHVSETPKDLEIHYDIPDLYELLLGRFVPVIAEEMDNFEGTKSTTDEASK